jgi:DNA-binding CsgD family transcriptional regulator
MEALIESQGRADVDAPADAVDVADLLTEFLSNMPGELLSSEAQSANEGAEVVLCSVVHSGVRFTLSCRPYLSEDESPNALSPREKEIVRLVMKGLSTRGIAQLLDISPWTVSTHLRRIFLKLGVNSRPEMVALIFQQGALSG